MSLTAYDRYLQEKTRQRGSQGRGDPSRAVDQWGYTARPSYGRFSAPGPGAGLNSPPANPRYGTGGFTGFASIGPRLSVDLQRDFGLNATQAAGIVGNLAHESAGFTAYNQFDGNTRDNKGGVGWAQWTGPRRREFEGFVAKNNLDPNAYSTNYSFLKQELQGQYAPVISRLQNAATIDDAVKIFEQGFERAGVKNYTSRTRYANMLANPVGTPSTLALQQQLNKQYNAGLVEDGIMGPRTRAAMAKYQAGPTAQSSTATATRDDIRQLQTSLNQQYGANLAVDGIMGPRTRAAVEKAQAASGINSPTQVAGFTPAYIQGLTTNYARPQQQPSTQPPTPQVSAVPAYTQVAATTSPALGATRGLSITASPSAPKGPGYGQGPYANSTGGAAALNPVGSTTFNPTPVNAVPIQSPMAPGPYQSLPSAYGTNLGFMSPLPGQIPIQVASLPTNIGIARNIAQVFAQRNGAGGFSMGSGGRGGGGVTPGNSYGSGGYQGGTYGGAGGAAIGQGVGGALRNR